MYCSQAPHNLSMQLGMAFDTFTQEPRVRNVIRTNTLAPRTSAEVANQQVQSTWMFVTRLGEIGKALGFSAAAQIKCDSSPQRGYGSILDMDHFNDHHVHYLVHVLATREVACALESTALDIPLADLQTADFSKVYGDCFISGFNEGGEFVALISVKLKEPTEANIATTKLQIESQLGNGTNDWLFEGDTSIVVNWRCGSNFVAPDQWTLHNIREEAMNFAEYALAHPIRISALLTPYETLKSFPVQHGFNDYMKTGAHSYAAALLDAYVGYKAILRDIEKAVRDVHSGKCSLAEQHATPELVNLASKVKEEHAPQLAEDASSTTCSPRVAPYSQTNALVPYSASVIGLDQAHRDCRREMERIVKEVDEVASNPQIASDSAQRTSAYLSPAVFRMLLPIVANIDKVRTQQQLEQNAQRAEALTVESADLSRQVEELKRRCEALELEKKEAESKVRSMQALYRQLDPYDGWCPVPLGPIRLRSVHTGKSMDFNNSVHQYDTVLHTNQKFEIVGGGPKGYAIRHCVSRQYLKMGENVPHVNGVHMRMGVIPTALTFEEVAADTGGGAPAVMIRIADQPALTLNVEGGQWGNGVKIIGYGGNKGSGDRWHIKPFEDLS
ncbi:hypothetical protein C8F01DRAFT_1125388 [Mycena amicta]|nr:hypothetical protein C8F01DRAFT_1125388 [Mycena amicta]